MTEDNMYKVTLEGKVINLPKYTLALSKRIEGLNEIDEAESIEYKLRTMYDFIVEVIGEEKTREVLGEFEDTDPNMINILFLSIIEEYDRPRKEFVINQSLKDIEDPRLNKAIDALKQAEKQ